MRNLDIGALRSLVAIADTRTVTKAAQQHHLTQSAVSMQIKRLEQTFDTKLLHREGRGVVLSATGQQLVSYARRLLALNDETWSRLTSGDFEGELTLGVPIDVVHPHVPHVLRRMREDYPRVKLNLVTSLTLALKRQWQAGEIDAILTTEKRVSRGGATLVTAEHRWLAAADGLAARQRPLPLATVNQCALRQDAIDTLDAAGVPWEFVVDTDTDETVNAIVAAGLAVTPIIGPSVVTGCDLVPYGVLPALPDIKINLYASTQRNSDLVEKLVDCVRVEFLRDRDPKHALKRTG
ncbi:MAG: LysR family transcriptional regulator [Gammaproteobacteria bacterium]